MDEPLPRMASRAAAVCAELAQREPLLHRPELGVGRADLERLLHEDFWEIGASGARYTRERVIDVVLDRAARGAPDVWTTSGFHCTQVAAESFLLAYDVDQSGRRSRRTTIWRRQAGEWRAVFHQGTPLG